MTEGYDTEFKNEPKHGKESVTVSDLNFDKVYKVENKVEARTPLHRQMADIKETNFSSRISQTTL